MSLSPRPPAPDGAVFKGRVEGDTLHGTRSFPNGTTVKGHFADDGIYGTGHVVVRDAAGKVVKRGQFVAGELHGKGTLYNDDGTKFAGTFCKGALVHGIAAYEDGFVQVGSFENFKLHGEGTLFEGGRRINHLGEVHAKERQYTGTFCKGYFVSGTLSGGDDLGVAVGPFKNFELHGEGTYCIPSRGRTWRGNFVDGELQGQAGCYDQRGKWVERGEFKGLELHGKGERVDTVGNIYKGNFVNGSFDGPGTCQRYFARTVAKGNFKDGRLEGKGEIFDANNRLIERGHFVWDQLRQGEHFHANGDVDVGTFQLGNFLTGVRRNTRGKEIAGYVDGEQTWTRTWGMKMPVLSSTSSPRSRGTNAAALNQARGQYTNNTGMYGSYDFQGNNSNYNSYTWNNGQNYNC